MTRRHGGPGSDGGRSTSGGGRRQRNGRHQIAEQASRRAEAGQASEPVGAERVNRSARRQRGSGRGEATPGLGLGEDGAARGERAGRAEDGTGRAGAVAAAEAHPEAIARQICLRLLTAAPRTQAQLAAALRRRGVPEDAAATVLARFAEVKLIDDEVFARAWVESRHYGRGLASRALGAELRQRGVASEEIDAALGQLSPEQELTTARELVERRLPATEGMPPLARTRRLTGVLARKGYSAALAYRVVREALEQESGSGPVPFDDDEFFPEPDEEAPAEAY
jgi:regulatory protein